MNPNAYPATAQPATRSRGPVPPPPMDDTVHRRCGRAGSLAPKWLDDVLSKVIDQDGIIYLNVGCVNPNFRSANNYPGTVHPPSQKHDLLFQGYQSSQKEASDPIYRRASGHICERVYSSVCQHCQHHFMFYVDFECVSMPRLCGIDNKNKDDPFHHLVFHGAQTDAPANIDQHLYPWLGAVTFRCSASRCPFTVTVEVSSPRLKPEHIRFLSDDDGICERLQHALETDPERFADIAHTSPDAPRHLWMYLRDIVEPKSAEPKKIDHRNKKYYIQFGNGPEASDLFTHLGFPDITDGDRRFWMLPNPPITRPTQAGTPLAFYQDVKSEIEILAAARHRPDSQTGKPMTPNAALPHISTGLDIGAYAKSLRPFGDGTDAKDFDTLGLMSDMHEAYFWYAFRCQSQANPPYEEVYFECLRRLAGASQNEELSIKVQTYDSNQTSQPRRVVDDVGSEEDQIRLATELSLKDVHPPSSPPPPPLSPPPLMFPGDQYQQLPKDGVTLAYEYFGLPEGARTDDEVLGKFVSLCEAYPSQSASYREKLLLIARHTNSHVLEERAVADVGFVEALHYLGVADATEPSYIINVAQADVRTKDKDYRLVAEALRTLGSRPNHRNSLLLTAAEDILAGHTSNLVGDDPFPFAVQSHTPTVNLTLPVGLDNIRNTCYLNSILQYLFTVKPIHRIVLNYDEYALPADEIDSRRIEPGMNTLTLGEAYAGRQFVMQLSSLFHELMNTPQASLRPPQRLALAALKNADQLENDGTKLLAKDQEHALAFDIIGPNLPGPSPPPLPARHASAPLGSGEPAELQQHTPQPSSGSPVLPSVPVVPSSAATALVSTASLSPSSTAGEDAISVRSSETLVDATDEGWQDVPKVIIRTKEVHADHIPPDEVGSDEVPMLTDAQSPGSDDLPPSPKSSASLPPPVASQANDASRDVEMTDVFEPPALPTAPTAPSAPSSSNVQVVFDPPPTSIQTVQERIDCALNDSSVTGTDQQDVEEVMGNILSHLRAAVKATGEDSSTGSQTDPITDTFYWTSATYTRRIGATDYNRQVAPNRVMTAYPDTQTVISLLQALDGSFQREYIAENSHEQFTSIVDLPPILHIQIQRTTSAGGKNSTAINIPEVLRLDRFMDSDRNSELFRRRRRAWNLQERLRSLKGPRGKSSDMVFPPESIPKASKYTEDLINRFLAESCPPEALGADDGKDGSNANGVNDGINGNSSEGDGSGASGNDHGSAYHDSDGDDDSDDSDGFVIVNSKFQRYMDDYGVPAPAVDAPDFVKRWETAQRELDGRLDLIASGGETDMALLNEARSMTPVAVREAWQDGRMEATGREIIQSLDQMTAECEQELGGLFDDLQSPASEYRLHAVVCHAGQSGKSGHYWVWVFDFERNIWRRYNDSIVTEESDKDAVFTQLSTRGEPYYLAYVRSTDVDNMAGVALRQEWGTATAPDVPMTMPAPTPQTYAPVFAPAYTTAYASDNVPAVSLQQQPSPPPTPRDGDVPMDSLPVALPGGATSAETSEETSAAMSTATSQATSQTTSDVHSLTSTGQTAATDVASRGSQASTSGGLSSVWLSQEDAQLPNPGAPPAVTPAESDTTGKGQSDESWPGTTGAESM